MGTSKTQPNAWMLNDGTGKSTIFSDERGWVRRTADGQEAVIHCMSGVTGLSIAKINSVTNPVAGDYSVIAIDSISFTVLWSEGVTITGTPQITFDENGVSQTADYDSGSSTATSSVFTFPVTTPGVIDNVSLLIGLNNGTIVTADDASDVSLNFPDGYVQPIGVNVIA